jgi:hypothetical protein
VDAIVAASVRRPRATLRIQSTAGAGRLTATVSVARSLTLVGELAPGARAFAGSVVIPLSPDWNLSQIGLVGVVQERASLRILGTGRAAPSLGHGSAQ